MILDYSIILNGKPYQRETADSPKKEDAKIASLAASKIRKAHLTREEVSASPFKNDKFVPYGSDPLSKKIIDWKKEYDITAGRNGAIVVFKYPFTEEYGYTLAFTEGAPGQSHAELLAIDKLPKEVRDNPDCILEIYSERKPCRSGSDCHRKLKAKCGNAVVSYSAAHTPTKHRQQENEVHFQLVQHEEGIRVANKLARRKLTLQNDNSLG